MFLTNDENNMEAFLNDIGFVPPVGTTLKYFIVPIAGLNMSSQNAINDIAIQGGYEAKTPNPNNIPGITDTITYVKKDFGQRQSFGNSNFDISKVPGEFPITREQPTNIAAPVEQETLSTGMNIVSQNAGPEVAKNSMFESTDKCTFMLKESTGLFPRNTLFHFSKEIF